MLKGPLNRSEPGQLRIVHCVRAPIGGIFRNVLDLAHAQTANGHAVGIVLDSLTGGEFEAAKIAAAAPGLALGITRLPMPRSINPSDVVTAARVFNTVRRMRPDVLHGHGAKGGVFARVAGTALSVGQKPVARLYSPHGGTLHYPADTLTGKAFFRIERALERICDGLIHVSQFEADTYAGKVGLPRCRTSLIVNGLRPEEFTDVTPQPDAADLVYMGMMRDLKGVDILVRAIAAVRDRTGKAPSARLYGAGDDLPAYRALAQDLGIADRISFHDPVPTRTGLSMGRVMVVPSRAESMPYIVLESVAAAIPVIATRVGGIPEILRGEAARNLVEPASVPALADAISASLADPHHARQQALAARRALRERFTVDQMSDAVERTYWRALDARRGRRGVGRSASLQTAD